MAIPRKASAKEVEENKRKQTYLRSHGYPNLPVDGSWGPWQEQQWRKVGTLPQSTTAIPKTQGSSLAAIPALMIAGAGTGAAAGAATGPAAPVVSPILAALGLTAAAGYGIYRGWDEIKPLAQSIIDRGAQTVKRAYNILGSYFYPEEAASSSEDNSTESSGSSNEPAPSSSQQAESSTTGTNSGTTSPAPANPNNGKGFKDRQKQVLNRVKKGYSNALIGLEYGVGFGLPIGGIGYGVYKWAQPGKTRADTVLDRQLYQIEELNKAVQINENQKKIDAILQQIQNGSPQIQPNDNNYLAPQQIVAPTDTLDF